MVFSAGTALKTVKTTEIQRKTETIISEYNGDGGKPQWRLRKTVAEHRDFQKPHACIAEIELTAFGALASIRAH